MSLQRIKDIGELREGVRLATEAYAAQVVSAKAAVTEAATGQFRTFMEGNGFTVSQVTEGLDAKYHDAKISLHFPDPKDQVNGALAVFRLLRDGISPSLAVVMVPTLAAKVVKKTADEVEALRAQLVELEAAKADLVNQRLVFKLVRSDRSNVAKAEAHGNFGELLGEYFLNS